MAQLLYFSWVRERIGKAEEQFDLPDGVQDVAALIEVLRMRGDGYATAFEDMSRIRIAVDQAHVGTDHMISNSHEIAFFPPVTGG